MKRLLKKNFFLLVLFLQKIFPRQGIPVLFFHSMDESGSPLSISRDKFLKFAEYLHKHGYGQSGLFTFDDGYKNNLEAVRILQQFNFHAVIFVATGYIGKKNTFCRKEFPELEMLNAGEIRLLANQGVEFGAHGHTHRNLTELNLEEIGYEIRESKRILEELIGKQVDKFCYPRGKASKEIALELQKQGFERAFTSKTGMITSVSDPYFLPRIPLNDAVTSLQFRALLSPWYSFFKNCLLRLRRGRQ